MADDTTTSRGVHLSDKQLVFVFMAATVIAVVVFLCGVLVGRGVQAVRGPVPDAAMITAPQTVSDPLPAGDIATGDTPPGADAAGGRPKDEFTYPSLGKPQPPPPPAAPPAAARASPEADASAGTAPTPMPDVPPDILGPAEPASDVRDGYAVQVAAVKKRAEADQIVRRLKAKGYEAYVFVPDGGDRLGVFRVRIGSYRNRRDAEAVARRLEREEQYKPWVTR